MGGGNMINNDGDESNELFPSEKSVVVDDDKLLETFKPAPLLSSCNDMIRPLSDAVHTLLCMNVIKEGITLPTIVVIGDRSSGKTSVIESLTGISLPWKSVPVHEDRIPKEISLATDQIAGNGKDVSDVSLTLVVKC
ncbi:dynamin-related protein 4C-like protein [Tanacetum coccineum]